MKKTLSVTAALGIALSFTAAASADPVQTADTATTTTTTTTTTPAVEGTTTTNTTTPAVEGTTTTNTTAPAVEGTTEPTTTTPAEETTSTTTPIPAIDGPIIKAEEVVLNPTRLIELANSTYFYDMPNGKPLGTLSPQKVDTTGNEAPGIIGGQWIEVYTWLGKAWIFLGNE